MSWEQLQDILKRNREARRQIQTEPPLACPIDGSVLDVDARGVRNCPMGNYRWDGGPVR